MRPITILRSTSQDEIKALYTNTYMKSTHKNVGVLIIGVNDGTEFESSSQDEVKAHYGLYSLVRVANESGMIIEGVNDEVKVATTAILKNGSVKEEVVTIPIAEVKHLQESLVKLDNVDENFSFSFKFL